MVKNLKNLVIFLGVIVLLLFSITIVSLIYKFKNRDFKNIENLELIPTLKSSSVINSFQIRGDLLYLNIKDNDGRYLINIYNLENGKQVGTIKLSE
ncbi:MAG: hypothetical protein VX009_02055 [Pseudomonadota bacterium]|nr:hypothetical protein [Pseudomonadota bacterium]